MRRVSETHLRCVEGRRTIIFGPGRVFRNWSLFMVKHIQHGRTSELSRFPNLLIPERTAPLCRKCSACVGSLPSRRATCDHSTPFTFNSRPAHGWAECITTSWVSPQTSHLCLLLRYILTLLPGSLQEPMHMDHTAHPTTKYQTQPQSPGPKASHPHLKNQEPTTKAKAKEPKPGPKTKNRTSNQEP